MATTVNSTGNLTTAFGTTGASVAAATTATGMFFNDNYGDFLNELVGLSSLAGNSTSMSGTLASGATFTLTGTNLGGTGDWGITSLVLTNGTESFTLTGAIPFDGTAFTGPEVLTNVEIVTNLGTQEVTGTGLDIDVSGGDLAFSAGSITTENTIVGTVSVTLTGTVNAATGAGTITGITLTEGLNTVTASGSYDAVAAHAALAGATTLGDLFQNAGSGGALLFGGDDQLIVTGPTAWFGFAGSDTLTGDAGDNTLDGGTGNDKMIGGGGNDTFIVDDGADSVTGGP